MTVLWTERFLTRDEMRRYIWSNSRQQAFEVPLLKTDRDDSIERVNTQL